MTTTLTDNAAAVPTITCAGCGKAQTSKARKGKGNEATAKLPNGWKVVDGRTLCKECVGRDYRTVALTVPVMDCTSHPWPDFAKAAHAAFGRTVRAKREAVRLCLQSDPTTPTDAKLAKWTPPKSLYLDTRAVVPDLSPGTVAALCQKVAVKYRGERLETHRGERSVPAVRYPQPVPIREQDYRVGHDAEGRVAVTFRLESTASETAAKFVVRPLKAKHERAYKVFDAVARGELRAAELQLDAREHGIEPGHAKGRDDGRSEGGARRQWKYVLRLVVRLPKAKAREASETLYVRTGTEADAALPEAAGVPLLAYRVGEQGEPQPPIHMDHVRRQLLRCSREQARLRHDLKREFRVPSYKRKAIGDRQRHFAELRGRLNRSCVNDVAAMVVNFAMRRRCGRLEYDDASKAWAPSFDWYKLRERLGELCRANGIELIHAAAPATVDVSREPEADAKAP